MPTPETTAAALGSGAERSVGHAIHATAVAIAARGLLIVGPSGAGKSRLALALIAASTRRCPIRLVGDDRILLAADRNRLLARPHPRIAGFIERRGIGIVAMPHLPVVPVAGVVKFGPTTSTEPELQNFPCFRTVVPHEISAATVLAWWRDALTTPGSKSLQ